MRTARSRQKKIQLTELELQSDLMVFADNFSVYLHQALDEYEKGSEMHKLRPVVLKDVVFSSIAAFRLAADRDPAKGLLDMVAMVSMGRSIYETHWQKRYGGILLPVVKAFARGESEIWLLAARVINEEQQRTLRNLVEQYRASHPEQTGFAHLHFSDLVSDPLALPSQKQEAGGLFKAVKEATAQVEEARLLGERGLYLALRMPLLLGNLGDFWVGELSKNEDIRLLSEDIHRFTSAVDRLAGIIDQKKDAAILQSLQEINTWSKTTANQTMQLISAEREAAIDQFFEEFSKAQKDFLNNMLAEEETYSRLLVQLRDTLEESNRLVASTSELAKMLPEPVSNEAAPSMDIEDYRAILADIKATIHELNSLLAVAQKGKDLPLLENASQLIVSSLGQVKQEGESLIDHSFKRAMLLILFGVISLLIGQIIFVYIKKKLVG